MVRKLPSLSISGCPLGAWSLPEADQSPFIKESMSGRRDTGFITGRSMYWDIPRVHGERGWTSGRYIPG